MRVSDAQRSDSKSVVIIGAGIGGLGLSALLAKTGYKVTVVEKNDTIGGRARQFAADGFTFDMGPSWYLMPDVFEHYFALLGEKIEDHLTLTKLSPSYRIFLENGQTFDLYSDVEKAVVLFDSIEPGAGAQLRRYLKASEYQYNVVMQNFMHKNIQSPLDFLTWRMLLAGTKLSAFSSMNAYVNRFFKSELLQKIMQYQLLFLGSSPFKTPSIYNVMGHIDFNLGVFYPKGGIYSVVSALASLARKFGADIQTGVGIRRIVIEGAQTTGVELENGEVLRADIVVSNADTHHTETQLLPEPARSFSNKYWQTRQLAPSALILYLGVRGNTESLLHHNILFNDSWRESFTELFEGDEWPRHPSLYLCCPSKTDPTIAPPGCETLFALMPISARLDYGAGTVERYADAMMQTIETGFGVSGLADRVIYRRPYSGGDFTSDYNAFGGSALGLAHVLKQTALFRPNNRSTKIANLYYVGASTNPGIGMPICLISAQLAFKRIQGLKQSSPMQAVDIATT
ncbi:MAG: phytoene desaturase [Chitinophagales bacterium]|nr:phytoene desaturase [Hyphomicrobiales bacterium]